MIGVASKLCGIHPQTLRQYERMGFIAPSRVGAKNRLYSEADIFRVKKIQRLTQELGVNLAGVEIILKLLDDMESMRSDMEQEFDDFRREAEERIHRLLSNSNLPVRKDEPLLPERHLKFKNTDF
ncbi:MAG: MerR family transcriptional regulator [Armatimonadetes bacterium]|nr:MerR family transcriptional regulator [Armatimonadota bacterium]